MAGDEHKVRNERFAAARAALRLTYEQVAQLVADYVEEKTGKRPVIDADHVCRIETGRITFPGKNYREAFRAIFRVRSDAELGFYFSKKSQPAVPAPVEIGTQLLAFASAATIGVLGDEALESVAAGLAGPGIPKRIGHIDVADLHRVIDGMERADHAAGGRTVVRSLAVDQLKWAQQTLQLASFPTATVRTAWMTAVARVGRLAGFMSVDARDHDTARRCFLIALQIAAQAEDWPSRLNVLSGMARQAVHLGDGDGALKITLLARAGEGSASDTTRAMLRVLEARAYGVLGRANDAVTAVGQAEDCYAERKPGDDPPWLWFYDEAQLFGDTGHALYPLALAGVEVDGEVVDAEQRLRKAVDKHAPTDTRGRTFSLVKLATLQVRHAPGAPAYETASSAIAAVAELRSGRALDYLNDLGRVLRRTGTDEATALAGEVSRTLRAVRRD